MVAPLFESKPDPGDAILVLDASARVVYAAGDVDVFFGRDADQLTLVEIGKLFADAPLYQARLRTEALHTSGARTPVIIRVEPLLGEGAELFAVTVSPDDEASRSARRQDPRYLTLAQFLEESQRLAQVGSFSIDFSSGRVTWSDELYRLYGLAPKSRHIDVDYMLSRVVPADRAALRDAIDRAARGGVPLTMKCRVVREDDAERVLRISGRAGGATGDTSCLIGCALDVTDDEEAEQERRTLEKELDDARRMTSLGRVAATMAHEFNNVLAGIGSFAEVLHRRASDDDTKKITAHIRQGVRRGKSVTEEILRYTRASRVTLARIDVRSWLEQFLPEATALTGGRVRLEVSVPMAIRGDVGQLNQVLVNLVINARDASPPETPIVIRASPTTREGVRMLDVAVIDRGSGIAPDIRDRIFEPLFTTKRSGTGLGLPLVDQIVRSHGGVVRVRSEVGKGSEFHALIPLDDAEAESAPRKVLSVLIADGDDALAQRTIGLLESEGLQAHAVSRTSDLVAALADYEPDALILDLGAPDGDGIDVYSAVVERWPNLPVVFVSGNPESELEPLLRQRHVAFLAKPLDQQQLLAALRRITAAAA